ncbi:MAG: T9SS type A sorting domain-containing protein [Bacteroidia bacterium]
MMNTSRNASSLPIHHPRVGTALIRPPMVILFFLLLSTQLLQAQPNPVVHGDSLLCPNSTGVVFTQQFDSYQWYKRPYGGTSSTAIPGATNSSLTVDYFNYAASYVSVFVTQNGDTATSPEFLVDGVAFLPPAVMTVGNFTTGPSGEAIICEGDSISLVLQMPYDTLIQWFDGGMPISGANSSTLVVTMAGDYTVEGAPHDCPGYVQPLGVNIRVATENCSTAMDPGLDGMVLVVPTVAQDQVQIKSLDGYSGDWKYEVINQLGQTVMQGLARTGDPLDISQLHPAMYWIKLSTSESVHMRVFIKS